MDLIMALDNLPRTVDDAFKDILDRIKEGGKTDTKLALKALAWVFHTSNVGVRPLKMEELQHLLGTREGFADIDDKFLPASRNISIVCQSLLVHDTESKAVNFIHSSVQEYLRGYPELPPVFELAKTCINYLSFDTFNSGPCQTSEELKLRLERYKAGAFVAQFWEFYYRAAEKLSNVAGFSGLRDAVYMFLLSENRRNSMLQMEQNPSGEYVSFTGGLTLLHVIAKSGLVVICRIILDGRLHEIDKYVHFASHQLTEIGRNYS
jgi:hypothetical protein